MADEIYPVSHTEKVIAGEEAPISHLEKILALYGGGSGSGGSGTNNYNSLLNKPSINGVDLIGNKTLADLGINLSKYTTTDKAVSSIELVDAIPTGSTGTTTEKCLRLTFADGTTVVNVSVKDLNYDDTKIKADIKSLQNNKVDKVTGKSLIDDTEIARLAKVDNYDDKAIKASIKTVADGLMASAGYSPDYKKLDIITVGGVKKNIDLLPIISHAKITELSDVDSTNQGNGKTLVYNSATGKHEYAVSSSTDELVKMDASGGAKYLGNLIDKTTIVNDNGTLVAKTLDGLTTSITELNYIKGLQMPVQDLVTAFANGGLKTIDTPFPTYADLQSYDVSTLLDDIRYLVRVLADETHDGKITAYLINKGQTTPTFYGYLSDSRDFKTNPIDLVNEITGKLKAKNIDSDDLFALLTISDVYKTATAKDEIFGTHGAKAMYDELNTAIGKKAEKTDLTTHTGDTDIHTSTTEKATWNTVTSKASKSDLTSHTGDTNIHITTAERTKWNKVDNKADKTDLTTHTSDTNIHVTTSDKTKWNKVDNKVDKTSILSAISNTPSDDKLLSEKAIKSELDKLKTNFEDGVDTVYDAVVARGTTPIDKTPSEIASAISKLGGDLTSIYNALTNKGFNMSGTENEDQISAIITDLMTIKSFTTKTDNTTFVFNGTKDTIKDTELVDTSSGLKLEFSSKELTSVESGGYIEFAEIDKAEYNNKIKFV